MKRTEKTLIVIILLLFMPLLMEKNEAGAYDDASIDLTELSIEELMDIEVISVAKKSQKLSHAAAAVFVITQEDIRSSGATSIPEVLRMVPGVQAVRIDSSKWAVSCRGFNGRYSNKLLVMIDGHIIYSAIFSGVLWEVQDIFLEDIDRIEVIRGPGASLWGANAVNGIINIITKHSEETTSGFVYGGMGSEDRGSGGVRYGDNFGEKGAYRIYAKYFNHDEPAERMLDESSDYHDMFRIGFRADKKITNSDELSFQGNIYRGKNNETTVIPSLHSPYTKIHSEESAKTGFDLSGRWERVFSRNSDMAFQIYGSRTEIEEAAVPWYGNMLNFDFQHRFAASRAQEITWGLEYRFDNDHIQSSIDMAFDPETGKKNVFGAFIQDDIAIVQNRLHLILGSKFEYNDYTGFEIQPSARILWTPHHSYAFWTAASRAVRTPSRWENDLRAILAVLPPGIPENPGQSPVGLILMGNRNLLSEEIIALEMGTRLHARKWLSFDIALFYNFCDNLMGISSGINKNDSPIFSPNDFSNDSSDDPMMSYSITPYYLDNIMKGNTWGAEVSVVCQMLDWWRIQPVYTYLNMDLRFLDDTYQTNLITAVRKNSPSYQFSLRSSMNFPLNLELDLCLRYVDQILEEDVDSYTELDARLGWNPVKNLEFSIAGRNLLEPLHLEFIEKNLRIPAAEVKRSIYGKITWRF